MKEILKGILQRLKWSARLFQKRRIENFSKKIRLPAEGCCGMAGLKRNDSCQPSVPIQPRLLNMKAACGSAVFFLQANREERLRREKKSPANEEKAELKSHEKRRRQLIEARLAHWKYRLHRKRKQRYCARIKRNGAARGGASLRPSPKPRKLLKIWKADWKNRPLSAEEMPKYSGRRGWLSLWNRNGCSAEIPRRRLP